MKLPAQIDEENELGSLPQRLGPGAVVVDFSEVVRINSCGVRDWVRCIGAIARGGGRPLFIACSPAVVAQMNAVNNFTEGATVHSFVTPYFCSDCDKERKLMCEAMEVLGPPFEPPVKRCDDCDGAMDFDDMPEAYFEFLASTPRYQPSAVIEGLLDDLGRPTESTSIRRRVVSGRTPRGMAAVVNNPLSSAARDETLPEADVLRPVPVTKVPSEVPTLETVPDVEERERQERAALEGRPTPSAPAVLEPAPRLNFGLYLAAGVVLAGLGFLAAVLLR